MIYCKNTRCGRLITMADKPPFCRRCRKISCRDCGRLMIVDDQLSRFRSVTFNRHNAINETTESHCPDCYQ